VDPSPDLQASADAQRVFITAALVDFSANDDELAAILAHEYAHIILGHPPDPYAPRQAVRGAAPRQRTADQELAADRLGLRVALRAGYDIRAAPRMLERLTRTRSWLRFLPSSHPGLGERRRRMLVEIERLSTEPMEVRPTACRSSASASDHPSRRC
jgi:predicted Zn-dependent protease